MQESDNILAITIVSIAAAVVAAAIALMLVLGLIGLSAYWVQEAAQRTEKAALDTSAQTQSSSAHAATDSKSSNEDAKPEPINVNASINECLQYPDLGGGCEIASMVSVLRALGYDVDLVAFAKDYVLKVKGEPNMVQAYAGDPYFNGAAFPPAMTHAGNNYLREQQAPWRFIEHSNLSLDKLLEIVHSGRPVLVWTTMYGEYPLHTDVSIEDYLWYDNEHCVVLYGETENGSVLIMDPIEGLIERDYESFKEIYEACGFHAATITQHSIDAIDKADADKVEAYEALMGDEEAKASEGYE